VTWLIDLARFGLERAAAVWSRPESVGTVGALMLLLVATPGLKGRARPGFRGYLKRSFLTDAAYTVFYVGGFYAFFVSGPAYRYLSAWVDSHASFLRVDALAGWPAWAHFVVLYAAMDGINYWVHRALHASPLLWAFHSIHHSQRELTPLTNFRFHFVDIFVRMLVQFLPGLVLGTPSAVWIPSIWLQTALEALAHADLDWSYGRLGRVFVSPAFHRLHHSLEPRHHNRNFSTGLSFWDGLFGTAVADLRRPSAYGTPAPEPPESFLRQLVYPFARLARGAVWRA
jgi:sterol desaturase/sphingolipid hydroxylase (fatty acid hydroxylase superfamily)